MAKPFEEAYALIEEMATNHFSWPTERTIQKRVASAQDNDILSLLTNQVSVLTKKIDDLGSNNSIGQSIGLEFQNERDPNLGSIFLKKVLPESSTHNSAQHVQYYLNLF